MHTLNITNVRVVWQLFLWYSIHLVTIIHKVAELRERAQDIMADDVTVLHSEATRQRH